MPLLLGLLRLSNLVRGREKSPSDDAAAQDGHRAAIAPVTRKAVVAVIVAIGLFLIAFGIRVLVPQRIGPPQPGRVHLRCGADALDIVLPAARTGCLTIRRSGPDIVVSQAAKPCPAVRPPMVDLPAPPP